MKRKILFILLLLLSGQPIYAQLNLGNNAGKSGDTSDPIQLSPPLITHKCVETDRGQDFDRPGIATYRRFVGKKLIKTETGQDSCKSDGVLLNITLIEYYCEGNRLKSIEGTCEKGCFNNYCKECNSDGDCAEGKKCNAAKQCEAEPYCARLEEPGRIVNGKLVDDSAPPATFYDSCFNKLTMIRYECAPNGEVIRNFFPCPTDTRCNDVVRDGARIGSCR